MLLFYFDSRRVGKHGLRKCRLHASPNALPYEGAAFNHRDETAKLRSAAPKELVGCRELRLRSRLIDCNASRIAYHCELPSPECSATEPRLVTPPGVPLVHI